MAAGALYFLGMLPSGIFWYAILRAMGARPTFGESIRAFYIGHLGKYVPGKAMVVVIRAGLLDRGRTDVSVAAVSVFLETLTMMAVGAFLSAGILIIKFPHHTLLIALAVGLMIVSGLPTIPAVVRRVLRTTGGIAGIRRR